MGFVNRIHAAVSTSTGTKDLSAAPLVTDVERRLKPESNAPRILVVREETGTGKTTVMRRAAFELAQRGLLVLNCSALSRVEPKSTASIIDLIDDPLVVFVDNFADQAYVFRDVIDLLEKKDIPPRQLTKKRTRD
ncbi:P-loop NTPase [Bradyrhizobium sp. 1.29L]